MELKIDSKLADMHFTFEHKKDKKGICLYGDRESFYKLHSFVSDCWDCEDEMMSQKEACSYIGVIAFFAYEVRHAFMGDRIVFLDGKPLKEWCDELVVCFEKETDRFVLGVELSWPYMFFIMASWWECFRRSDCPVALLPVLREFTENIERLLAKQNRKAYPLIEPYIHGAIYAANPYLMHAMEIVDREYAEPGSYHNNTIQRLAELMQCSAYQTTAYRHLLDTLKRNAKRLNCEIEELRLSD